MGPVLVSAAGFLCSLGMVALSPCPYIGSIARPALQEEVSDLPAASSDSLDSPTAGRVSAWSDLS